jgi:hypothetical protein
VPETSRRRRRPSSRRARTGAPRRHVYAIHDILGIASERRLPELERFRVAELDGPADIEVRVGRVDGVDGVDARTTVYREVFGGLGFALRIDRGDPTEVTVSPLIGWSPHVLYTNVIEPMVRWALVERGYALVHAACVARQGKSFLITAKTDTGKTTTMLHLLESTDVEFVSDDMVILSSDGGVLPYPKPLTVSYHTVSSVDRHNLGRVERAALPVQSRLHSRSGRRTGFAIARAGLPAASMNALVQMAIPPPKYDIARLIPDVTLATRTDAVAMFILERSPGHDEHLAHETAMDVLMANCEDAYGFPPYRHLESFLHSHNGQRLRADEQHIISSGLDGAPTVVLRSSRRDWAQRIPSRIAQVEAVHTPAGGPGKPSPDQADPGATSVSYAAG